MASTPSSTKGDSNQKPEALPGAYPPTPTPGGSGSPTIVSSHLSLSHAVHERKAEYTVSKKIRIKIGSWNVAAISGTDKDIGGWFLDGKGVSESLSGRPVEKASEQANDGGDEIESVEAQEARRSKKKSTIPLNDPATLPGGDEIGLYVLGLQEIVDVGSVAEAIRPYSDPHPGRKWKQAVEDALPPGYQQVAEQQLIGLYLIIYASPSIMPTISSVSTTSVGTGLMGYMGNKGAVTTRLVLGETTRMVFVNCHLTAGNEKGNLEKRNWDVSQILSRTKFDPINDGGGVMEEFGEGIGDEDFAFWFGDLNYRLEDMPGEDVRRLLMLHTRNEYGHGHASQPKIDDELGMSRLSVSSNGSGPSAQTPPESSTLDSTTEKDSNPSSAPLVTSLGQQPDSSSDPTSLQTTLDSLLTHDQLHSQMRSRLAFHDGWREGPIDFLPTYKYDVGSVGMFDSSEKRRGPSWCDRILYRTRRDKLAYEQKVKEEEIARKKDNELHLRGVVEAIKEDEAVLFDYDPDTDGADTENQPSQAEAETVITKDGFEDRIHLDYYTSHQRVLSSDHKPLDAIFTLDYDAVDPDLKAKVHQEVARELDKAENEGRPVVTIVVDRHRHSDPNPNSEGVDFGDVKYDHHKIRSITIANTGRVPATVGFVDRPVGDGKTGGVAPPWLSLHFDRPGDHNNANPGALQEYTLQPGDAANVEMTLHITNIDLIRRLSEGEENLDDVLVLRIQNGRDYFLPLRATWQQSAFGRSIEKLVRIPEGGVRKLQQQRPDGSSHGEEGAVKLSAPRELFRLTEAIEALAERSVAEFSMIGEGSDPPWEKSPGWPFEGWVGEGKERNKLKELIREALDCDLPFSELWPPESSSLQWLESIAETLVVFVTSLEDGIIPTNLWTDLEKTLLENEKSKTPLSTEDARTQILDILSTSPAHSVSFTFITFMLVRVANEIAPVQNQPLSMLTSDNTKFSSQSELDSAAKLLRAKIDGAYAEIFAAAMVRLPDDVTGKVRKASESRRKYVVEVFLVGEPGAGL